MSEQKEIGLGFVRGQQELQSRIPLGTEETELDLFTSSSSFMNHRGERRDPIGCRGRPLIEGGPGIGGLGLRGRGDELPAGHGETTVEVEHGATGEFQEESIVRRRDFYRPKLRAQVRNRASFAFRKRTLLA